jgi:hypothetical protein
MPAEALLFKKKLPRRNIALHDWHHQTKQALKAQWKMLWNWISVNLSLNFRQKHHRSLSAETCFNRISLVGNKSEVLALNNLCSELFLNGRIMNKVHQARLGDKIFHISNKKLEYESYKLRRIRHKMQNWLFINSRESGKLFSLSVDLSNRNYAKMRRKIQL